MYLIKLPYENFRRIVNVSRRIFLEFRVKVGTFVWIVFSSIKIFVIS